MSPQPRKDDAPKGIVFFLVPDGTWKRKHSVWISKRIWGEPQPPLFLLEHKLISRNLR